MKLASLKAQRRDGELVVVDAALARFVPVPDIAPTLQAALDNWSFVSEEHGIDLEAEVAVITAGVPLGIAPEEAAPYVRLVMLVNDWSLRNLIPPSSPRASAPISRSRPALSPRWPSRRTSWEPPGTRAGSNYRSSVTSTARGWAPRTPGWI